MLSISTVLKYSGAFILIFLVTSFLSGTLTYALIGFINSTDPKEAYARGLLYVTVSEEWAMAAYLLGIAFLPAKLLYLLFHLRSARAKIKTYLLILFLLFLGFGLSGGGSDWSSLYTYAFLIPMLLSAFMLAITEDKLTKKLFKTKDNKDARK